MTASICQPCSHDCNQGRNCPARKASITRTADSLHDMRPLEARRAEAWAAELRECIAFAFVAIVTVYAVLSL